LQAVVGIWEKRHFVGTGCDADSAWECSSYGEA